MVDVFFRRQVRAWLAAFLCTGAGLAHAANPDARTILTPPALVDAMRCSAPRYVLMKGFFDQLRTPRRGYYTEQQARAMMSSVDSIVERYCRVLNAQMAERTAVDPGSLTGDPFWAAVQGDETTLAWLRLNSQFLAEIESLHMLALFGAQLAPAAEAPLPPETDQVRVDATVVSLDDEQRDARLLLAGQAPRLKAILPARFDVDSLAHIEAMTRTDGAAVLQRHHVSLAAVHPAMQDLRAATPDEKRALQQAEQAAKKALAVLARHHAGSARSRNR